MDGLDYAIEAKSRAFLDARANFTRQQDLRSRRRKGFWKSAKAHGTNEKKQRQLEAREGAAYAAMVALAEEVQQLQEMKLRLSSPATHVHSEDCAHDHGEEAHAQEGP